MDDIATDYIGHWAGSAFRQDQTETTGSCINDFEDYGGDIHTAAYIGMMRQFPDTIHWSLALMKASFVSPPVRPLPHSKGHPEALALSGLAFSF